jgi:hypothetical protein
LRAARVGHAYVVNRADLERAVGNRRKVDGQAAPRRGRAVTMSAFMFVELTERLDAQAAELAALRLERDQLADRLRAITYREDAVTRSPHERV